MASGRRFDRWALRPGTLPRPSLPSQVFQPTFRGWVSPPNLLDALARFRTDPWHSRRGASVLAPGGARPVNRAIPTLRTGVRFTSRRVADALLRERASYPGSRGLPMSIHRCACGAGHSRVRYVLREAFASLRGAFTLPRHFPPTVCRCRQALVMKYRGQFLSGSTHQPKTLASIRSPNRHCCRLCHRASRVVSPCG